MERKKLQALCSKGQKFFMGAFSGADLDLEGYTAFAKKTKNIRQKRGAYNF